jgi:hypothetical protein
MGNCSCSAVQWYGMCMQKGIAAVWKPCRQLAYKEKHIIKPIVQVGISFVNAI